MSKTPGEWDSIGYDPMRWKTRSEWFQAIIDDARAGMVPEGELQEAKARDELNGECIMLMRVAQTIEKLRAELADARASYDASHAANTQLHDALVAAKAELAKAWEAGRDAAADCIEAVPDYSDMPTRNRIRALQPPGGKAK